MAYLSDVFRFRGEGAVVPWELVRHDQDERASGPRDPAIDKERATAAAQHPLDTQLRWMVSPELGMPNHPFIVYRRPPGRVPVQRGAFDPASRTVPLPRVAAVIRVAVQAPAGSTVMLSAARVATRPGADGDSIEVREMVAAVARTAGTGTTWVELRCGGATVAEVDNGQIQDVRVAWLDEVVDLPDWEEIEWVGLPFEVGTYNGDQQGPVTAPMDPPAAAEDRLRRGLPPIGWFQNTETSVIAPHWVSPDPRGLVKEVTMSLQPQVEGLFTGDPAHVAAQQEITDDASADPGLPTTVAYRAFDALTLPAASEAGLALALGFGTAYPAGDQELEGAGHDYLVVARFDDDIPGSTSREIAAFIPSPQRHERLSPPLQLQARSSGLLHPEAVDQAWSDDAQVQWLAVLPSAALERPTLAAFARSEPAYVRAISLLPPRESGGDRPLVPTTTTRQSSAPVSGGPATPATAPGWWSLVDGTLTIPVATGARPVRYSVAHSDVFGLWSPWEDVDHQAKAPPPPRPGVVAVSVAAGYQNDPAQCPTTTTIDLTLDWEYRTPASVTMRVVLFPTSRNGNPPGLRPNAPVAPPAVQWTLTMLVSGDQLQDPVGVPAGVGVHVEHLNEEGDAEVVPGPAQGAQRRRYRIVATHLLDYTSTSWWGVEAWAVSDLVVGAPSAWSPPSTAGDTRPPSEVAVFGRSASPVPPTPPTVPVGPEVPLASSPDAQGNSHARVPLTFAGAPPEKVSVWEVSESALWAAVDPQHTTADTATPSQRLAALRVAYDGLTETLRRSVFRRALTLDGSDQVADVTLPRGSTDIHLFALTAVTSTGVESTWPQGSPSVSPHEYLHAVIAPRMTAPAPPTVRVSTGEPGGPMVRFETLSRIPVAHFDLYASRAPQAARAAVWMGFPVASPTATLDTTWAPHPDIRAEEGMRRYIAQVPLALAASWDPWLLRAVAVPVEKEGRLGLRGARSSDSPVTTVEILPPDAPDLGPVTGRAAGGASVTFESDTDVAARAASRGEHMLRVVLESAGVSTATPAVSFSQVQEVADPSVKPSTIPSENDPPLVLRGPRTGGRTPLGVWWTRPDTAAEVSARLTLTDPLGRVGTATGTAPPVSITPGFELTLVGTPTVAAKWVGFVLGSSAPRDPDWMLRIVVTPRPRSSWLRPRPVIWSATLDQIPTRVVPIIREPIQVRAERKRFFVLVRVVPPLHFAAELVDPRGSASVVSTDVSARRIGPNPPITPVNPFDP